MRINGTRAHATVRNVVGLNERTLERSSILFEGSSWHVTGGRSSSYLLMFCKSLFHGTGARWRLDRACGVALPRTCTHKGFHARMYVCIDVCMYV